jgi:hypothetical protein
VPNLRLGMTKKFYTLPGGMGLFSEIILDHIPKFVISR